MIENMIEVKNVTMKFKMSDEPINSLKEIFTHTLSGKLKFNEFLALDDVSFNLEKGKTLGLIGKNGAGKYKVVTQNDPLGIRIQAAKDSERVSEIPKGSEIEILTVYDKWGYVNYDGVGGWVAMEYVELISATNVNVKHEPGKYTIATQDDPLGIRTKPEQDAERAGEVPKGETVEILAVYGEWGYVNYDGINGWLSFQYLKNA